MTTTFEQAFQEVKPVRINNCSGPQKGRQFDGGPFHLSSFAASSGSRRDGAALFVSDLICIQQIQGGPTARFGASPSMAVIVRACGHFAWL